MRKGKRGFAQESIRRDELAIHARLAMELEQGLLDRV